MFKIAVIVALVLSIVESVPFWSTVAWWTFGIVGGSMTFAIILVLLGVRLFK